MHISLPQNRFFVILFFLVFVVFHNDIYAQLNYSDEFIRINQVGYMPFGTKIAIINTDDPVFYLIDSTTGKIVFTGKTSLSAYWKFSGDTVRMADFSSFTLSGNYKLSTGHQRTFSSSFIISDTVYKNVACDAIRAFYYNRASCPIITEFGRKWAREEGHPDTVVYIHSSAASALRPEGYRISSPGGWYDAGDYNKYVVNSGISTYTLLLFYEMFSAYSHKLNTHIPESLNDIPDIVDELLWNLKWMLTMQDPNDGGVYHKLTNKSFDPFVMPDKATSARFVVQKTTAATLDFAAVTAMASRIFAKDSNKKLKDLSGTLLEAAKNAIHWAKSNPAIFYRQPSDIFTGEYGDNEVWDEFFWANAEMAITTKDYSNIRMEDIQKISLRLQSWGQVETLGMISLASVDNPYRNLALAKITSFADILLEKYNISAYKVGIDFFNWGSNSDVANEAMLKIVAQYLTKDKKYMPAIQGDVDYILGRNPTGYCYVTGSGNRSPRHIHHRISAADGIDDPIPGLLVGGPNKIVYSDCNDQNTRSPFPAKAYNDNECSYSTNEIAINWNAPLFFMLGAMEAMK